MKYKLFLAIYSCLKIQDKNHGAALFLYIRLRFFSYTCTTNTAFIFQMYTLRKLLHSSFVYVTVRQ